jgi:hypothetical protein
VGALCSNGSADAGSQQESGASIESAGSGQLLEQAAAALAGSRGQQGAAPAPLCQQQGTGKQQKGKNAAMRFLSRLGQKKDKYQNKERGGPLQVGVGCCSACCTLRVSVVQ